MKKVSIFLVMATLSLGLSGSSLADGIWPRNQVSIFDPRLDADPWDEPFSNYPSVRVSTVITGVPERDKNEGSFWRVIGIPLGNAGSAVYLKWFGLNILRSIGLQSEESRRNIKVIKN